MPYNDTRNIAFFGLFFGRNCSKIAQNRLKSPNFRTFCVIVFRTFCVIVRNADNPSPFAMPHPIENHGL